MLIDSAENAAETHKGLSLRKIRPSFDVWKKMQGTAFPSTRVTAFKYYEAQSANGPSPWCLAGKPRAIC
jgi:hypothetical protein